MTNQELRDWAKLKMQAYQNDLFVTDELLRERLGYEYSEFIRLNHLVMEQVHTIHNMNMMG